jgi:hypothetical protein
MSGQCVLATFSARQAFERAYCPEPHDPQEEELHPLHELPPIEAVKPVSSLARQEKRETMRLDCFPQVGQAPSSSDWLIGRSSSNFEPQSRHEYS